MEELDQVVTRMVFENYGVEKYHDDHIQSIVHTYRFNQYKGFDKTGIDEGLRAHIDKTFSTTLYQNHVKGLEIYSKDNEWISVDPLPSSFIFLAGDGFQVWHKKLHIMCLEYVNNSNFSLNHMLRMSSVRARNMDLQSSTSDWANMRKAKFSNCNRYFKVNYMKLEYLASQNQPT